MTNVNKPLKKGLENSNLKGKVHQLTIQDSSKGGKSLGNRWDKIRNCSKKCPFHEDCNYKTISLTVYEGKCYVKQMPSLVQTCFKRLKTGKESQFNIMLFELLEDFISDPSESKKDKLAAAMKLSTVVFGSKMRQKISNDEGTEFVVRFKKEGEEVKE